MSTMSDYNDFSGGAGGAAPSKQEIMDQVRSQLAVANAQELLQVCGSAQNDRYGS